MRPRKRTETFGLMLTVDERLAMAAYLKARQLTNSEYLRQVAIDPVVKPSADREQVGADAD